MFLKKTDPQVWQAIQNELKREEENLELIASENFVSKAILEAQGSVLTNKYAEGYPHARWYGGCEFVDEIELLAIERAKKLFNCEHVNVQPHSGSQANMAVYFAVLKPGDKIMALDLSCGGHLTHGHPHNFSGTLYQVATYRVNKADGMLDYAEIERLAIEFKPQMIVCGASAYPRTIDFAAFRNICDKVGAYLMVDMAHIAGLVAVGVHPSPVPHAEFVTTTTHKTLRGPRAGMIICRKEFAKKVDSQIFPGIQGGPLMHVIAAKAVCFKEALRPQFKIYQQQVVKNAKALAAELGRLGFGIVTGGTDTHLLLVDLTPKGLTGREAEVALDQAGITVNKNLIPFDTKPASIASGIRLGTAAVTTRGLKEKQIREIAVLINTAIVHRDEPAVLNKIKASVRKITKQFPLYAKKA
ncbi:MAG: serine hydroxymethyltransferase [Candidatus Omnitrophota bacterium]